MLAVFAPAATANDPTRRKAKLAAAVPFDRSPQNHSKKSKRPEKSDLVSTGELLFAVVAIHFDFAEFGKILGKGSSFFCSRSAVIGIRPSAAAIGAEANAALGLKHNFSVLPIANALNFLNGGVNNSSFIWVHRLKGVSSAASCHIISFFARKVLQGFNSFFAVIANVDNHSDISAAKLFNIKACKILKRIKRFASSADDDAVIVAINGQLKHAVLNLAGNLGVCNLKAVNNCFKVIAGF